MKPHCIICEEEIEVDDCAKNKHNEVFPPITNALYGRIEGNYGSSVFDPISSCGQPHEFLRFFICDNCVIKKSDKIMKVVELKGEPEYEIHPAGFSNEKNGR